MLASKISSIFLVVLTSISFSMSFLLYPMESSNVAAALNVNEVLRAGDRAPEDNQTTENPVDFGNTQEWEKRFGEKSSRYNLQGGLFQSQNNPSLRLKSPGILPGIEFGVEMHNLQGLQSFVPSEILPKGLDLKQEQPLFLPPSNNALDYNGGFLRFTW